MSRPQRNMIVEMNNLYTVKREALFQNIEYFGARRYQAEPKVYLVRKQ